MIDCPRPYHFPCYPVAVLNIEVNCLLLPGVRMTRDFIYIYINWHPRNTPRIDSWPPDFPQLCPIRILAFSFSLYLLLLVSLSVSSSRDISANISRAYAGDSRKCEKSRGNRKRMHSKERRSNEQRSFMRETISFSASLFLFLSITRVFLSARLRFDLFDVQNRALRVEATWAHDSSLSFCAALFTALFYLFYSISFSLSWKRTCL